MNQNNEYLEELVTGEEHETRLSLLRKALVDGEESETVSHSLSDLISQLEEGGR